MPLTPEERKLYEMEGRFRELDPEYASSVYDAGGAYAYKLLTGEEKLIPETKDMQEYVDPVTGEAAPRKYGNFGQYTPSHEVAAGTNQALLGLGHDDPQIQDDDILRFDRAGDGMEHGFGDGTLIHELFHRADRRKYGSTALNEELHQRVYARVGYYAKNERQWNDAVKSFMYYTQAPSFEDAEKTLQQLVEANRVEFDEDEAKAQSLLGLPLK